jgi:hypothetical protein
MQHGSNNLHNGFAPKHNAGCDPTAPIKGTGLSRRRKGGLNELADLAVDVILGRPFIPSRAQIQREFRVPAVLLRERLNRRKHGSGNGDSNGNGGNGPAKHSTPAAPAAPASDRFVVDHQLTDLITALDATIDVLRDLRDRKSA